MIDFRGTRTLIREFNDLAINIGCQKIALTEPRFQFEYAELKNQVVAIDNELYRISTTINAKQPRLLLSRILHPRKFKRLSRNEYMQAVHNARRIIHDILEQCSNVCNIVIAI